MQREQVPVWWDVCETVAEKYGLVVSAQFRNEGDYKFTMSSAEIGFPVIVEASISRDINPVHYYTAIYDMVDRWWKEHNRQVKAERRKARKGKNQ